MTYGELKYTRGLCDYGRYVIMETSWSNVKLGKRYLECLREYNEDCDFFAWYDVPICGRSENMLAKVKFRSQIYLNEILNLFLASCLVMFYGVIFMVSFLMQKMLLFHYVQNFIGKNTNSFLLFFLFLSQCPGYGQLLVRQYT